MFSALNILFIQIALEITALNGIMYIRDCKIVSSR